MTCTLRDGLSWCACGGRIVLLDVPADRYLALPDGLDRPFRDWAAGAPLSPEAKERLVSLGLLVAGEGRVAPAGLSLPPPARDVVPAAGPGSGLPDLLAAALALAGAALELRLLRLETVLRRRARRPLRRPPSDPDRAAGRIAAAFERLALLLGRTDRCLPRALAAWSLARRAGLRPALVFGVRLGPFGAHGWVQLGDAVLVGEYEQARLFAPILVLT